MDTGHGSGTNADLRTNNTTPSEGDHSISGKKLNRSSSSSSQSSAGSFDLGETANTATTPGEGDHSILEKELNRSSSSSSQSSAGSFELGETANTATTPGEGDHSILEKELNRSSSSSSQSSAGSFELGETANTAPTPGEGDHSILEKELNRSSSSSSQSSAGTFELGETANTATTPGEGDHSILEKELNRSSSSTSQSSGGSFKLDETANTASPLSSNSSQSRSRTSSVSETHPATTSDEADPSLQDKKSNGSLSHQTPASEQEDSRLAPDFSRNEEDIPVSSMPGHVQQHSQESAESPSQASPGHSSNSSATTFPPPQVMERPGNSNSNRIPPYVFARTSTTARMDWSAASNESLFSIHMGNMSFTRDQLAWLGKSGELGISGEITMSGPLLELSISQPLGPPPVNKSGQNSSNMGKGSEVTEAKAAETMREVIRESAKDYDKKPSAKDVFSPANFSRRSDVSHGTSSTNSFAFPILAGDGNKSISLNNQLSKKAQRSQPGTPKAGQKPADALKTKPQNKWLSCFSCCPFCI